MGIFGDDYRTKQLKNELHSKEVGFRLQKGKLKKEIREKDDRIESLLSDQDTYESRIEDLERKLEFHEQKEVDAVWIERRKREAAVKEDDLTQREMLLKKREEKLLAKQLDLEEDNNYQYKTGYADGLADGLRKAHEITREDRKMMTMIAMSTNKSEAISEAGKVAGQLEAGTTDAKAAKK